MTNGRRAKPQSSEGAVSEGAVSQGPGPDGSRPALRRWDPVVVDRATEPFEPSAPRDGDYRPDVEADGWSSEYVTVRTASVRGYSHRYYGIVRQDSVCSGLHPSGAVLFAVADGVSSARYAERGSQLACVRALHYIHRQLSDDPGAIPDWEGAFAEAADVMTRWAARTLGTDEPDPQQVESMVATTLVAGVIRPAPGALYVSLATAGDSGAWLLRSERYTPLLASKHVPGAAVMSSGVRGLPRHARPAVLDEFVLEPGDILLAGTDGFGDPLGDGDGMVGRLFARALAEIPPPLGLAHLLDFSRETFDDDRSLVAVWPRALPVLDHEPGRG